MLCNFIEFRRFSKERYFNVPVGVTKIGILDI